MLDLRFCPSGDLCLAVLDLMAADGKAGDGCGTGELLEMLVSECPAPPRFVVYPTIVCPVGSSKTAPEDRCGFWILFLVFAFGRSLVTAGGGGCVLAFGGFLR